MSTWTSSNKSDGFRLSSERRGGIACYSYTMAGGVNLTEADECYERMDNYTITMTDFTSHMMMGVDVGGVLETHISTPFDT
jgi:hypothetical protein